VFYYKNWDVGKNSAKKFSRHYFHEFLDVPPIGLIDKTGTAVLMTFQDYYAYGVFTYNKEFRMVTGKTLEKKGTKLDDVRKFESMTIPWLTNEGKLSK